MTRTIEKVTHKCKPQTVDSQQRIADWLAGQKTYKWLLAHCYDGVVWGEYTAEGWQTSSGYANSPALRWETLLELRLFSETQELFVWRVGDGFRGRAINDTEGDLHEYYDEAQILWGSEVDEEKQKKAPEGFTVVVDGQQQLKHVVPISDDKLTFVKDKQPFRPLRLHLRHYVKQDDETGLALVEVSRLVKLEAQNGS